MELEHTQHWLATGTAITAGKLDARAFNFGIHLEALVRPATDSNTQVHLNSFMVAEAAMIVGQVAGEHC